MSERLLIRLQPDGEFAWLAQDAHGRVLSGAAAGAPSAETLARAQRVVVLVPSEDVLLLDTPGLTAQRAQFVKAVPFALEDQLAGAVEELHFALPDRYTAARVAVAVVARRTLRGWLDRLAGAGIQPDAIYAETQILPWQDGGSILFEDGRALWRRTAVQAGACDLAGLPDWLEVLAGESGASGFEVYDFRDAPPLPLAIAPVRYHARQHDLLGFFAAQSTTEPALNLLQGEFAPAHRQMPAQRLWRNAAALVAAAVILLFVYYGLDCWRLARTSARLDVAAQTLLRQGFPEMDKVAGDPRELMRSAMTRLQGGADNEGVLKLLEKVAPILGSTTRTSLTGLEYHNATLELALRAPDVQTLDLMRERLANLPGLKVEVTAANSGANGIDGRLRISGGRS